MAHIGDVHDVLDLVAIELEDTAQYVLKEVGAQVANVGIVVHCRPAGIHANLRRA